MRIIIMKYQPKYDHDFYKIDPIVLYKKPTEKQIEKSKIYQKYNAYYKKLLSGDRSSEVLKELDNLQDIMNGETNS